MMKTSGIIVPRKIIAAFTDQWQRNALSNNSPDYFFITSFNILNPAEENFSNSPGFAYGQSICGAAIVPHDVSLVPHDVSLVPHDVSSIPHDVLSVPHDVLSVSHDVSSVPHDVSSIPYAEATVHRYGAGVPYAGKAVRFLQDAIVICIFSKLSSNN